MFNTKTKDEAFALIDSAQKFLRTLEGARLQGGPVAYANKSLFDFGDAKKAVDDEPVFDQQDDDDLRALEEGMINE